MNADEPRSGFWSDRVVAWYRRAAERGDYAARVIDAIGPALDSCHTALDVGAGCGALAIPLARRLQQLTALEPRPPPWPTSSGDGPPRRGSAT